LYFAAVSIASAFSKIEMLKTFALLAVGTHGLELTKETWDEATAGKTVFVKFLAPW